MQNISQVWHEECIKTSNFMMSLTCVMLKNYREQEFLKFYEIRCDDKKLNDEIIDFITAFGGLKKTYNFFANAYIIKNKHIICIYRYCNRFRIQPYRLRMPTNFTIVKPIITYDYHNMNTQEVV
jgi:hypothetical protein